MKTTKFLTNLLVILLPVFFTVSLAFGGNKVEIRRAGNAYKIFVNGASFQVKGAGTGYAFGRKGENFLRVAKDMGANTVRTWGTDQSDQKYLDEAWKLGLYVNAGFWLNPVKEARVNSYITDDNYKQSMRRQILDYVKKYKDHPAILFWNVGNEVFYFTAYEEEKVAFAKFLNSLAKEIKAIDPDHPTIYTSAALSGLDYIIQYAPEIDIFGMNLYGGISFSIDTCLKKNINRPLFITELGPMGPWDLPKDRNGQPIDPSDTLKAETYKNNLQEAMRYQDAVPGIFIFHVGETTQESATWWNINFGSARRAAFWEIRNIFTGDKTNAVYPKIRSFTLSRQTGVKPGEWLTADMTVAFPKADELTFEYYHSSALIGVLQYYVNDMKPLNSRQTGDELELQMPGTPGIYRIYTVVRDKNGNAAAMNVSVKID